MNKFSELLFQKVPIIGILRGYSEITTLEIIEAYIKAGFTTIEITINTLGAVGIISTAQQIFGDKLNIGAGTVCNPTDWEKAVAAGATFVVCPILDLNLIKKSSISKIPIFPGAYTPTEIYQAWEAGARMVKVFPSNQLGPQYIRDVLAPLNEIELMPTGGVSLANIEAYKNAGAKAFGMGSLLFNKTLIEQKDWKGLLEHLTAIKEKLI